MYPAKINEPYPKDDGFDSTVIARRFWRQSYQGGRKYRYASDAYGSKILIKHESETDAAYTRRLAATPVNNYTGPIIRRYNDFVFRKDPDYPAYVAGGIYSLMIDDTDGNGTPASEYWRGLLRAAQIDGISYSLITSNKPESAADAPASAGYRMHLMAIDANSVVWTKREGGTLVECAILMENNSVRHYDAVYMTDYILDASGQTIVAAGESVPHGIAGLPVVDLFPRFAGEQESQSSDIAESQRVIFNLNSLLSEEMYANTFTQWVLTGVDPEAAKDAGVEMGSKRIFCLPNSASSLSRIGSDVAQADSLRRTIDGQVRELYRGAGVDSGDPTGAGNAESGIARAFKFNDLAANLSALASAVEVSRNKANRTIAKTLSEQYDGDLSMNDDFSPPSYGEEMIEMVQVISSPSVPQIVKQVTLDRFVNRNLTLSKDDRVLYEMQRESLGQSPLADFGNGVPT